jgi:methyl-accepting chemotaxis protein
MLNGLKHIKFKTKLIVLAGTAVGGLLIFTAVALATIATVGINSDLYKRITLGNSVVADYVPPSQSMLEPQLLLLRMSDDPQHADRYVQRLKALRKDLEDGHATYLRQVPAGSLRNAISGEAFATAEQLFDVAERDYIPLILSGKADEARHVRVTQMDVLYDRHAAAVDEVVRLAGENVKANEQDVASLVASRSEGLVGFGVILAVAVGLLGFLTARSILSPLKQVAKVLHGLAQRDLTSRLRYDSRDEMGEMSSQLNRAMDEIGDAVAAIEGHARSVASAAEELSSAATQSTESARTQNDQATQVATAVQEMASTVVEISNNSGKAAEAARNAAQTARRGGKIVEGALTTMRSIAGAVGDTATKIEGLGKSSDQIGKIIGVIDEIADQTNLLALNAAIEAARAGEQGRGFAVVADEVRKLAERTTKATREITQMIESVQQETAAAVAKMQSGTEQVNAGVETTTQAGSALTEIIAAAEQVGSMVEQIAAAAIQQSAATDQISDSVEKIVSTSGQSAAGAQQSATACQGLSDLALDLQQLVARFNLTGHDAGHFTTHTTGSPPSPVLA